MEMIVSRGNIMAAYSRVVANKGAPGVDGMPVTSLKDYLQEHWPCIFCCYADDCNIYVATRTSGEDRTPGFLTHVELAGIPGTCSAVRRFIEEQLLWQSAGWIFREV